MGDLNARTGCGPNIEEPAGKSQIFGQSVHTSLPPLAADAIKITVVNKMGKELVHLSCFLGLYMFNCRMRGDSHHLHILFILNILFNSWDTGDE